MDGPSDYWMFGARFFGATLHSSHPSAMNGPIQYLMYIFM